MDLAETRRLQCDAFRALADMLRVHMALRSNYLREIYSLERFCDKVDRLCGTGQYAAPAPVEADFDEWEHQRANVLLRMLDRMNALVDFIEDPRSEMDHAAHLLPSRSTIPMNDAGVVAFCRAVHTSLLPVPGAITVRGGFASRMRNLNASVELYTAYVGRPAAAKPSPSNGLDHYDQRCANCLHMLLKHVDPVMHNFAAYISFHDAYYVARTVLMERTVEARKTYFNKKEGLFRTGSTQESGY